MELSPVLINERKQYGAIPFFNKKVKGKWTGNWKGKRMQELPPICDKKAKRKWRGNDKNVKRKMEMIDNGANSNCL